MSGTRRIRKIVKGQPTIEGAGVHLHRAIGLGPPELTDPFLLLDDFRSDRPADYDPGGARIKVIAGTAAGVTGPVRDVVTRPEYIDVTVPAGRTFAHETPRGHTVFAYVVGGRGLFGGAREAVGDGHLVLFGDGDEVTVRAEAGPVRFLLVSGRPIGEPVAWRGPIVMNTQEELRIAFEELERGTFVKAQGR